MSHTSADRPSDPPIPDYRWVVRVAPNTQSTTGCYGCAFRKMAAIRCSRIPCHVGPNKGKVAELILKPREQKQ